MGPIAAAQEAAKLPNTPAIETGQQILQTLRGLDQRLHSVERTMVNGLAQLDIRSSYNSSARVQNSHVIHNQELLTPLRNVKTNELVEDFPTTAEQVERLTDTELTRLLQDLGIISGGSTPLKKERFRRETGLPGVRRGI